MTAVRGPKFELSGDSREYLSEHTVQHKTLPIIHLRAMMHHYYAETVTNFKPFQTSAKSNGTTTPNNTKDL
jgi:hypothetical protein